MKTFKLPPQIPIRWQKQYRIIATKYPPIDLFERLDIPDNKKRALWALQARVNARLLQSTGNLSLVREEDMLSGANASIVMAAFTHIGFASRFTNGDFGVYYASRKQETAIRETVFHRQCDAQERKLLAQEFDMRAYIGRVCKPLYDVRSSGYEYLHDPDPGNYSISQTFSKKLLIHDTNSWGMVFRSVRHQGGECIAALRPPAVSLPINGPLLTYVWDGKRVKSVYEKSEPLLEFS